MARALEAFGSCRPSTPSTNPEDPEEKSAGEPDPAPYALGRRFPNSQSAVFFDRANRSGGWSVLGEQTSLDVVVRVN